MRPLIGITTSELRPGTLATLGRAGLPPHHELMLGTTYPKAIDAAGAIPVVLAPVALEPARARRAPRRDLPGGRPDLDPIVYGAIERHPDSARRNAARDAFELAVARAADARGLPLLGICRGAQTLNVARGGTLHQHVEGHRQTEVADRRRRSASRSRPTRCWPRSPERRGTRGQQLPPPGRRRARRRPARRRAAADGTVEAIEDPRAAFVLGVQWHAETLIARPEHGALFAALVEAASAQPRRLAAAA